MEFNHLEELNNSWKTIWKNQSLFWAMFVMGLIFVALLIPIVMSQITTGFEGLKIEEVENTGSFDILKSYYISFPNQTILILSLSLIFTLIVMSGLYSSLIKLAKGKKINFSSVFTDSFKNIVKFIPMFILSLIISFSEYFLPESTKSFYWIISLFISFLLYFSYYAIADNKGAINGIIYSVNKAFTSHRTKVFFLSIGITLAIYLIAILVALMSLPLVIFVVGIPLIMAVIYFSYLGALGVLLYQAKAYLAESQPLKASKQGSNLSTSNSSSTK